MIFEAKDLPKNIRIIRQHFSGSKSEQLEIFLDNTNEDDKTDIENIFNILSSGFLPEDDFRNINLQDEKYCDNDEKDDAEYWDDIEDDDDEGCHEIEEEDVKEIFDSFIYYIILPREYKRLRVIVVDCQIVDYHFTFDQKEEWEVLPNEGEEMDILMKNIFDRIKNMYSLIDFKSEYYKQILFLN